MCPPESADQKVVFLATTISGRSKNSPEHGRNGTSFGLNDLEACPLAPSAGDLRPCRSEMARVRRQLQFAT